MSPETATEEFEPKIISKYQRNADGIEERSLSLYAAGMSTRDIKEQIKGLYDVEISEGLVSKISERILPEVKQWQDRPLEALLSLRIHGCHPLQDPKDHLYDKCDRRTKSTIQEK